MFKRHNMKKLIKEGSSGSPIMPFSGMRSEDRAELGDLYYLLIDLLGREKFDITFNQSNIVIKRVGDSDNRTFSYNHYVNNLVEYMKGEGIKLTPTPKIVINKDLSESENFFRSTAQYDPSEKKITLYTGGRHPKDVVRSLAHELIHHSQNIEGRIHNVETTNTNEDTSLASLEEEAYLKGNILFRKWEDMLKNKGFNILEGK